MREEILKEGHELSSKADSTEVEELYDVLVTKKELAKFRNRIRKLLSQS